MKLNYYIVLLSFVALSVSCASASVKEEVLCKQKEAALSAQFVKVGSEAKIKIKFQKNMNSFKVVGVRGLDGLTVSSFSSAPIEKAELGQEDEISLNVKGESGLQYIVVDFQFQENNQPHQSSVTVAVGAISKNQLEDRASNIKILPSGEVGQSPSQQQSKTSTTKRIHKMKLE